MLLLILKSFRFCLLKGYSLPPLRKGKILLGCLLSTQVNDCDIFNSHKKCRTGLFIYNKAVTVKKFSLPSTSAVSPLFSLFPPILSLLSRERSKCWSFQRPCLACSHMVYCLVLRADAVTVSVYGCSLLCLQRSPSMPPGMIVLVPAWGKKATSLFSLMPP